MSHLTAWFYSLTLPVVFQPLVKYRKWRVDPKKCKSSETLDYGHKAVMIIRILTCKKKQKYETIQPLWLVDVN